MLVMLPMTALETASGTHGPAPKWAFHSATHLTFNPFTFCRFQALLKHLIGFDYFYFLDYFQVLPRSSPSHPPWTPPPIAHARICPNNTTLTQTKKTQKKTKKKSKNPLLLSRTPLPPYRHMLCHNARVFFRSHNPILAPLTLRILGEGSKDSTVNRICGKRLLPRLRFRQTGLKASHLGGKTGKSTWLGSEWWHKILVLVTVEWKLMLEGYGLWI